VLEPEGFLAFHQFEGMGTGAIIRLPLETNTAWKIKDNTFCTLGSLWCLLTYRDLKPSEYMRKTSEIGVQNIRYILNEVKDYFTGVKNDSDMIDVHMRTQTLIRKNDLKHRAQKGMPPPQEVQKKREIKLNEKLQQRIEAEQKMSVNDFLNERELKLQNRNSVLQSPHFNFLKVLQLGYERIES
jgi:hypothetical protein